MEKEEFEKRKYMRGFSRELKAYTKAEKFLALFDVIIALTIIFFSQKLIQTQFGKASLSFGIIMLGLITVLRIYKVWGPKDY